MESLTFIIPAYNDEATIETVIRKAGDTGIHIGILFDILVTDDASTDETPKILSRLTKHIKELSVVTHTKNAGYGQTIKELYQKAHNTWLFSLPGDYQIEPEELRKLWSHRNGADVIIGWRRLRRDIPSRLRQSRIYNTLLRVLFHLNMHDVNSVRLMKTSIMNSVHFTTSSAFVDAELAISAKRLGFRIMEVPIAHRARAGLGASGGKVSTILPTIRDMIAFLSKP
jgi:glycosyltransferase involved in cell wall biosynthesis